jgi:hypothetical protein
MKEGNQIPDWMREDEGCTFSWLVGVCIEAAGFAAIMVMFYALFVIGASWGGGL